MGTWPRAGAAAALAMGALAAGTVARACAIARPVADDYQWHLPRGFPTPAVPADNPMSVAKVELGRRLFFETRLSVTGSYSCASCHDPARAYSDGRARAVGSTGELLTHGAMSLANVAYNISYGWTKPNLSSLEAQMLEPLLNQHPVEIGIAGRQTAVVDLLAADASYATAFRASFPDDPQPMTFDHMVKAIAAFERTLIFGHSPFDRYVFNAEHEAITAPAKRGMRLFYSARAGCSSCHSGFNFDGNWRDASGESGKPSFADNGLGEGRFRVPTLRNIALTAPYMHDGRYATLAAVIEHYSRVARQPDVDRRLRKFDLSSAERQDLIAFLEALSDSELLASSGAQAAAGR